MGWLKIRKHDIMAIMKSYADLVVGWLKIRKHDIVEDIEKLWQYVVGWLKIRKHDIFFIKILVLSLLWVD